MLKTHFDLQSDTSHYPAVLSSNGSVQMRSDRPGVTDFLLGLRSDFRATNKKEKKEAGWVERLDRCVELFAG